MNKQKILENGQKKHRKVDLKFFLGEQFTLLIASLTAHLAPITKSGSISLQSL